MDFSVIVPVYNKEKIMEACIGSLLGQDYPKDKYEIIIVDNNSTDGSRSIIAKYPCVKLVCEKDQRAYAARNAGIRQAKGAVIAFTDADVEVKSDWLKNMRLQMDKNAYDILIGWCFPSGKARVLRLHSLFICERIRLALALKDHHMVIAAAGNLAVKKDVFNREGMFLTASNADDTHFVVRCCRKGYRVGFDASIEATRNDVNCLGIYLLKNFIYGCSNMPGEKGKPPLSSSLKHAGFTIRFMFRNFPFGFGLLPVEFSYFAGYFLSKTGIINTSRRQKLVCSYTNFINRKGL